MLTDRTNSIVANIHSYPFRLLLVFSVVWFHDRPADEFGRLVWHFKPRSDPRHLLARRCVAQKKNPDFAGRLPGHFGATTGINVPQARPRWA